MDIFAADFLIVNFNAIKAKIINIISDKVSDKKICREMLSTILFESSNYKIESFLIYNLQPL